MLVTLPAGEHSDGNPPGALPRHTPVRAVFNHAVNAFAAPMRNPAGLVDLFQGFGTQPVLVHRDKPLRRRTENDRLMTAPAVRVGMFDFTGGDQKSVGLKFIYDIRIRLGHELSAEMFHLGFENASVIHGIVGVQPVFLPDDIVLLTVAGCRVHTSGALLEGDMIPQNHRRLPVDKRVAAYDAFQILTRAQAGGCGLRQFPFFQ